MPQIEQDTFDEPFNPHTLYTEYISQLLGEYGIDIHIWGQPGTKTLGQLLIELESGESELATSEVGELIRRVSVARIFITYDSPQGVLKLVEDRQEFKNGGTRKRTVESSVSEKLKAGEEPLQAARRALEEELGITSPVQLTYSGINASERISDSYPGLTSQFVYHNFGARFSDDLYHHQEVQSDKTTFFVWQTLTV